ncbi:MAG: CocE/NonD family hydrolase, partial [Gemmatimonadota bacterium]|nr:CocE/NonD family hydrolase [Gemmatimonadota bacterium]
MPSRRQLFLAAAAVFLTAPQLVTAQGRGAGLPDSVRAKRWALENELESLAVVDRKVMLTMRDGIRIPADIYRPKDASKKYPVVWSRTPYNFNFWDVANGVPRDMTSAVTAVKRGYAWVDMQERGHFFAEGNYDILGAPVSDGVDEVKWMTAQKWSNGKVGSTGCSSTAEWQGAVVAQNTPGYAAFNVQGFGAGVGRVGPYYEQGNWYRGGAVQMLFIDWLLGEQNQVRPMLPKNATQEDLVRAAKSFDLAQHAPPVDWAKNFSYLPEKDMMKNVGGPHGIFADSMPGIATGGAMIQRAPNDPA